MWRVTSDFDDEDFYIFLDKSKRNIATLDDIIKIKPLNARTLNHSPKWKVTSVDKEERAAMAKTIKQEKLPKIDVFKDIIDSRKPIDNNIGNAVLTWVKKVIKDQNKKALGYALNAIYKVYKV